MTPADTFIFYRNGEEQKRIRDFETKLEETAKALLAMSPSTVETLGSQDGYALHKTSFLGEGYWRRDNRPLQFAYSVGPGKDRPVVRLSMLDLRANHTTTFVEPLRLDGANYRGPGCSVQDVIDVMNIWWGFVRKTASPFEFTPNFPTRHFHHVEEDAFKLIAPLIRGYGNGGLVDPEAPYSIQFLKPYMLARVCHWRSAGNPDEGKVDLTPIFSDQVSAILDATLPSFLTLTAKDTRRVLGFALNGYTSGPLFLPTSKGPVEDMKTLRRFGDLDFADLFAPGIQPAARAA